MTAPSRLEKSAVSPRAWSMLGIGVAAQAAGTVFVSTPAFLIPLLHSEHGLSLTQAGTLAAAPTFGMVLTLVAWGALADRFGEKWVISIGLALTAFAALAATTTDNYALLGSAFLLGGMAAASTNAASGRVVVGWFPKDRRGLAMGIRQMSQPLGVTIASVTIPTLAAHTGIGSAVALSVALNGLLALICAVALVNPPRPASPAQTPPAAVNPYRSNWFLWRIHIVSALLVFPQFTLSTFGLVWLISEQQWDAAPAGILIGVSQFVGALGRIVVGMWSDHAGSRVGPLRLVSISAVVVMLAMAAADATACGIPALILLLATTVSVADNGLAFTSVAEAAGPQWQGKALGAQNTGQFIAASAVGPVVGALIGLVGYPIAFAIVAAFPAAAIPLVPKRDRDIST
ncbi:MFS transporter [Rhodococcus sp. IEGM 1379]|uniref:MFS transporter n=1 Tax=Rhodococcus sp. IEGM 1379 TaxID=3047086 RepID=UPI0024B797DC|nr:MFS transporter [Rhodococcus sp. IEGM 1379]MDI9914696.1 MFS transporter [Rhodococcus sp. IEGM 1379]